MLLCHENAYNFKVEQDNSLRSEGELQKLRKDGEVYTEQQSFEPMDAKKMQNA